MMSGGILSILNQGIAVIFFFIPGALLPPVAWWSYGGCVWGVGLGVEVCVWELTSVDNTTG